MLTLLGPKIDCQTKGNMTVKGCTSPFTASSALPVTDAGFPRQCHSHIMRQCRSYIMRQCHSHIMRQCRSYETLTVV
jgi:hypothetical protein